MLVPGRPFQPSMMFVGQPYSQTLDWTVYTCQTQTLKGKILTLPANISLGWEGLSAVETSLISLFG